MDGNYFYSNLASNIAATSKDGVYQFHHLSVITRQWTNFSLLIMITREKNKIGRKRTNMLFVQWAFTINSTFAVIDWHSFVTCDYSDENWLAVYLGTSMFTNSVYDANDFEMFWTLSSVQWAIFRFRALLVKTGWRSKESGPGANENSSRSSTKKVNLYGQLKASFNQGSTRRFSDLIFFGGAFGHSCSLGCPSKDHDKEI